MPRKDTGSEYLLKIQALNSIMLKFSMQAATQTVRVRLTLDELYSQVSRILKLKTVLSLKTEDMHSMQEKHLKIRQLQEMFSMRTKDR